MQRPDFTPSDPDFESRVRASFGRQAMMRTLGIGIIELGAGWIDLEFEHDDRFTQQHGFAHAGVVTTAMDSACGYAAFSLMPVEAAVLTVEFKVNLLRPARRDRYRASAAVVKPGRTLTVCGAEVVPANEGKPIATMTATMIAVNETDLDH